MWTPWPMLYNFRPQPASGWVDHKERAHKYRDSKDVEEEEKGTETQRSTPQYNGRNDESPKCYGCGLSLIHI